MAEKRVQVSIPESAYKVVTNLAEKMDETKGKIVKIAVDAYAKKVNK